MMVKAGSMGVEKVVVSKAPLKKARSLRGVLTCRWVLTCLGRSSAVCIYKVMETITTAAYHAYFLLNAKDCRLLKTQQ